MRQTDNNDLSLFNQQPRAGGGFSSAAIYMLRTAQQHHVQLSAMADQKASILIGASLVVITMLLGQIQSHGSSAPMLVMGVFTFLAALSALFAVTPSLRKSPQSDEVNWLFFGAFARVSAEDYQHRILSILATDEGVYEAMIRDIYQMGHVLNRKKYRFLSYSYRIFIVGLLLTFAITLITYLPVAS
jgi:hypothetical protein